MRRPHPALLLPLLLLVSLRASGAAGPDVSRLAAALRQLYAERQGPGERWGGKSKRVLIDGGREVARDAAYRDHGLFPAAAAWLISSPSADDAVLGAWLLGTTPPERHGDAETILVEALGHVDRRAAFEAARALGDVGGTRSLPPLAAAARSAEPLEVRSAAAWAAERVAERHGVPCPPITPIARLGHGFRPRDREAIVSKEERLDSLPAFGKGVNWWRSEARSDAGAASFRALTALGVDWISIHTWDPLQRKTDDPHLVEPDRRFGIRNLPEIVRTAHAAGLRVMVKPHLEMRLWDPTPDEERVLRGPDSPARAGVAEAVRARAANRTGAWHNLIEMRTESDWQTWFREYGRYLLAYAEQAGAAGADMFCVGREMDRTVVVREADWRRLIARVRGVFPGPLVYSANFDSYQGIGFWDALDYVGISAYFPLSGSADPSLAELEAGWERPLSGLEAVSKRFGRPVLLTEVGYPSIRGAAGAPWREGGTADPWLQARCYEATFRAASARPWIHGTFWWLWEGTRQPPFRDASYSIQGKPAAFVLAHWYRGW